VAATITASIAPSTSALSTVLVELHASRTAITSSICSSSVAVSGTGSESPLPRRSKEMTRECLVSPSISLRAGGKESSSIVPRLGRTIV
jgi:hypothetical protein